MIAPSTLSITTVILSGTANLTATPTLNALATGSFATAASMTATASLSAGATVNRVGAATLSAPTTLTTNGTVSSGTTVTQLGNTMDSASTSASSANKTVVSKATASVNGTITAGHARLWVDAGTASVKMCVYADSSGTPGSLLALSDALTLSNTT